VGNASAYPPIPEYGRTFMHEIIVTDWHTHSRELADIRIDVFIKEQQITAEDEWDELDETATHFLVYKDSIPIACARLFIDEHNGQPCFHIGRVAVLKSFRKQGIGHQLMEFIVAHCVKTAPHPIHLNAQLERCTFYQHLGFIAQGDIFIDAGIPHVSMFLHIPALLTPESSS